MLSVRVAVNGFPPGTRAHLEQVLPFALAQPINDLASELAVSHLTALRVTEIFTYVKIPSVFTVYIYCELFVSICLTGHRSLSVFKRILFDNLQYQYSTQSKHSPVKNTDFLQSKANASRELPCVNTPVFSEIFRPARSGRLKIGYAPRCMRVAMFNIPVDVHFIQYLLLRVIFTVQNWKVVCVDCGALAENRNKP